MKNLLTTTLLLSASLPTFADTFFLNTDDLTFTKEGFENVPITDFDDVTLSTSFNEDTGFAVFTWNGDHNVGYGNTYRVIGSRPIRIEVQGNLWLPNTSSIDASADGMIGHAGGGNGGATSTGGDGGDGGIGSTVAGGGGGDGSSDGDGTAGGPGGSSKRGSIGGFSRVNNGSDGFGISDSGGVLEDTPDGGARGPIKTGGPGGPGGTGDSGANGTVGTEGKLGNSGGNGEDGPNGVAGSNPSLFNGGANFFLYGGGGGSSGASGAGGGGAASGSAGGGGGGGSYNSGLLSNAGGGAGGVGGRPGNGGSGDKGGNGGAGGGGGGVIDLKVDGIFAWDGELIAKGGNGQNGSSSVLLGQRDGKPGLPGSDGSDGEQVGLTLFGGNGAGGGVGGAGGNGGAGGDGGSGAGGAGGSIRVVLGGFSGGLISDISGGSGGSGAPSGETGGTLINTFQSIPGVSFESMRQPAADQTLTDLTFKTIPGTLVSLTDPISKQPDLRLLDPGFQAFENVTRLRVDLKSDLETPVKKAFFRAETILDNTFRAPLLFSEDFETESGWTFTTPDIANSFLIGDPSQGRDEQNRPIGPGPAPSGTKCLATAIAGNYANNLNTTARSPVFTIPMDAGIVISYWEWYDIENGFDQATVSILSDRGLVPIQKAFPVPSPSENVSPMVDSFEGVWVRRVYTIFTNSEALDVQLNFNFTSDGSITRPGWYIDDIRVYQVPAE